MKLPNPLRWLLVLPVSVAAYFAVQLINILCTMAVPDFMVGLVQLFNSWAGPIAFVLAGVAVAPRQKRIVAMILAATNAIVTMIFSWVTITTPPHREPTWWIVLCALAGICGGFIALLDAPKVARAQSGKN